MDYTQVLEFLKECISKEDLKSAWKELKRVEGGIKIMMSSTLLTSIGVLSVGASLGLLHFAFKIWNTVNEKTEKYREVISVHKITSQDAKSLNNEMSDFELTLKKLIREFIVIKDKQEFLVTFKNQLDVVDKAVLKLHNYMSDLEKGFTNSITLAVGGALGAIGGTATTIGLGTVATLSFFLSGGWTAPLLFGSATGISGTATGISAIAAVMSLGLAAEIAKEEERMKEIKALYMELQYLIKY